MASRKFYYDMNRPNTYTTGVAGVYAIHIEEDPLGEKEISAQLGAIQSRLGEVCFEYYEVVAIGDKVRDLMFRLIEEVDPSEQNLLIHFRIANAHVRSQRFSIHGQKTNTGGLQMGDLIDITCVEVDKEVFYSDETSDPNVAWRVL